MRRATLLVAASLVASVLVLVAGVALADVIQGTDGPDTLFGTPQADNISGGGSADNITARPGPDRAFGDSGTDEVRGQAGNDRLFGGTEQDSLFGNRGNDRLFAVDDETDTVIDGGGGFDICFVDPVDPFPDCEDIRVAT